VSNSVVTRWQERLTTSWAPQLTGIVARLLSLRPALKPFEVRTILYWMIRGPKAPLVQQQCFLRDRERAPSIWGTYWTSVFRESA